MDEGLQLNVGHSLMDGTYLVDAQFPRQHDALEAQVTQPCHLFGRTVVTLRRGMQTDRRQGEVQQMEVLNDQCIYADAVQVMRHADRLGVLVVTEQGVEGDQHLHPV